MATTKKTATSPVKEESLTEKIGHAIGSAAGAIKEKFNELVHPAEKKARPRRTAAQKQAAAKAAGRKPVPAKKAAVKAKPAAKNQSAKKKAAISKTASQHAPKKAAAKPAGGKK